MTSAPTTGHGSPRTKDHSSAISSKGGGRPVEQRMHINIRIDPNLLERIDDEAKTRVVSRTYLIIHAVEEWLEEHEGAA